MEVYYENIERKEKMSMHKALLHLAKAVLCAMMIFLLSIMLVISNKYPIMSAGIILFIMILLVVTSAQLSFFVGYVIKGNRQ